MIKITFPDGSVREFEPAAASGGLACPTITRPCPRSDTRPAGAGFACPHPGAWICSGPGSACSPWRLRLTADHPTLPELGHHASFEPLNVGSPTAFKYIRWAKSDVKLDPIARTELDAFAERLNVNPGVRVEIAVHSDARDGADAAKLDQRRADAVVDYLIGKGVKRDRLVAKGYGFSKMKNHCAPGVTCTEEEHAENRRVEFTITSITPP